MSMYSSFEICPGLPGNSLDTTKSWLFSFLHLSLIPFTIMWVCRLTLYGETKLGLAALDMRCCLPCAVDYFITKDKNNCPRASNISSDPIEKGQHIFTGSQLGHMLRSYSSRLYAYLRFTQYTTISISFVNEPNLTFEPSLQLT